MSVAARVQKLRKQYPEPTSAVLPALRVAQEEHGGWLPPEALREVAEVLDLTPAYCFSIASAAASMSLFSVKASIFSPTLIIVDLLGRPERARKIQQ